MIRALFKLVLVVVLVAAAAAFFFGYRLGDNGADTPVAAGPAPAIDTARAREAGARVGETVATGAAQAQQTLSDGALTTKIKAKMALDDTITATSIDIDTNGTVVTLSGSVRSQAERDKAVALARDTAGVTQVVDRLVVR